MGQRFSQNDVIGGFRFECLLGREFAKQQSLLLLLSTFVVGKFFYFEPECIFFFLKSEGVTLQACDFHIEFSEYSLLSLLGGHLFYFLLELLVVVLKQFDFVLKFLLIDEVFLEFPVELPDSSFFFG